MHSAVCVAWAVAGAANYPETFAAYIFHPAGIPVRSAIEHRFTLTSLEMANGLSERTMDTLNSLSASSERFFSIRNHDWPYAV